jgi:very-short-patch-repair endonuclease
MMTGVYIGAAVAPDPVHGVMAALLVHPEHAFASHASAGRVYDLPLPAGLAEEHISVFHEDHRRRRPGIVPHIVPEGTPTTECRGLRVSSPAQTFVELAEQLPLVDLVVVGDHFVRKGRLTPEELVAYCAEHGSPAARRAASYVRRDVDSPMETRLRMLIVLAGLPEPVVNFKICWEDGTVRYRFDLSYPDYKIVVEYDGRHHREDLDQWDHDVERREWMDRDGWRLLPVFSWGIYKRPDRTLDRIHAVLTERGCPDLPARPEDEWRAHFPVRS